MALSLSVSLSLSLFLSLSERRIKIVFEKKFFPQSQKQRIELGNFLIGHGALALSQIV